MGDDVFGGQRKRLLLDRLVPSNKLYRIIDKTSLEFEKPGAIRASPTTHFRSLPLARVGWNRSVGTYDSLWAGRSVDRIRWGGEIFRTHPHQQWGPPSLLYNGYRVFHGG